MNSFLAAITLCLSTFSGQAQIDEQPKFDSLQVIALLHNDQWHLKEVCVMDTCQTVKESDSFSFGIETKKTVPNYCATDISRFYTIGKYHSYLDPVTGEVQIGFLSCPEYFRIVKAIERNYRNFEIMLCTPEGFYKGVLKIKSAEEIDFIANRPEYDNQLVVRRYKIVEK